MHRCKLGRTLGPVVLAAIIARGQSQPCDPYLQTPILDPKFYILAPNPQVLKPRLAYPTPHRLETPWDPNTARMEEAPLAEAPDHSPHDRAPPIYAPMEEAPLTTALNDRGPTGGSPHGIGSRPPTSDHRRDLGIGLL